jgi:HD-GYP domain-containing protein (c-di-GMP phosphodiesterase class II)
MGQIDGLSRLRLAELLAALSVVTDLGIGRPPETAMRSCLLAVRLAEKMGIGAPDLDDVYYASLLRYVGCTAYAHEEAALWGGETWEARNIATSIDWRNLRESLAFSLLVAGSDKPPLRRAAMAATALPRTIRSLSDLVAAHCEVGADMARRLGLGSAVQDALQQIFERWDGKGAPQQLSGEHICLPIRFAHVATYAAAYAESGGAEEACNVIRRRSGGMLDPAIADAFQAHGPAILAEIESIDVWEAVVEAEPQPRMLVPEGRLDDLARAFADMVDLQTPFTRGHSSRVADLVGGAADAVRMDKAERTTVHRAALFHDLGRVGVSNTIWGKPGPLTSSEWERVRLHPYHTERILARSPVLLPLSRLAGMHHERLDGSGYHREMAGSSIPFPARLLAAADVYAAVTQDRPHRPALTPDAAARELTAEAERGRLDAEAVRAVLQAAGHRQPRRTAWPAGLSEREVEVLRLIARGASYKEVAQLLTISPRTAAHHVQHIYNKVGVSTRAGAAMFAMEHDLLTR